MLDTVGEQRPVNDCWMLKSTPPCFVLLGRAGDLIQMLPCWLAIYQRTGHKPVVIVSRDYATVLEGVTYIKPYVVNEHWWKGVPKARQLAQEMFGNAVVPRWWLDDKEHARMVNESVKGDFVLQCHGESWGVDLNKWPDYGTSMASRCGFDRDEWVKLPLVFDNRSVMREEKLAEHVIGHETRPVVLYNFTGQSSPFGFSGVVLKAIRNGFGRAFRFIDLGAITAFRIYDLLGLYDRAAGLLTSDTATWHLAPASKIPWIGFHVDSWSQSVPKGNCLLSVGYNSTPSMLQRVLETMVQWRAK